MTITATEAGTTVRLTGPTTPLRPVVFDTYRDIHKGIRADLFAVTHAAGEIDPSSDSDRRAVADHVRAALALLVNHAEHEDQWVQPLLDQHLPHLAERVAADHPVLEARIDDLAGRAQENAFATTELRWRTHQLYIELASFTSAYLAHQDFEEREIMPALEDAIGPDAVLEMDRALVASIPPDQVATALALMLPAMNIDDRVDMLGGMRAGAPAEVFDGVWNLAGSVLEPRDVSALAARIGV